MTVRQRIRRAQRLLIATVASAALMWAATLALSVVALAALAGRLVPLPSTVLFLVIPLTALAALGAGGWVLWRGRAARSAERVALWIEERDPRLQFALVTAMDERIAPPETHAEMHAAASAADVKGLVRTASRRTLTRATLAFAIALGLTLLLDPRAMVSDARAEVARRAARAAPPPMANRLESMTARVTPPAYARMRPETIDEPSAVHALVGSRVELRGDGPADGVSAIVNGDTVETESDGDDWVVGTRMDREPAVVTLRDRQYHRLVLLEPRADSAPKVRLRLPASDTTYQVVPRGRLEIAAEMTDDVGLAYSYVEYMVTSGGGENFETRAVNGRRRAHGNGREGKLGEAILFDTLPLSPGSVLHIRVVTYDFNDVTGPGIGASETRTLRIAEPIDSTSVNAAPPLPIDSMWVSQRLLNMRTDTLLRTRRRLSRQEFTRKSSAYSNQQEDIRRRALAVVALLEDNGVGGAFETETSTKLREAAELMWIARTHLGVAEPDSAMPHMRRILAILDEIRLAHRYYLRGLLKPVAVNVERVRHTGTDPADPSRRPPRRDLPDPRGELARRIDAAAALARHTPAAAIDSLTFVRATALRTDPAIAGALGDAIASMRRGASADSALAATRRALEPRPRIVTGASDWGGVQP